MGFNTTVVVLNDALSEIENDPEFGKKLVRAIGELPTHPRGFVHVPAGSHGNAAVVIEQHHADYTALVAVGGNTGKLLASTHDGGRPSDRTTQKYLLAAFALELGYGLVEKGSE